MSIYLFLSFACIPFGCISRTPKFTPTMTEAVFGSDNDDKGESIGSIALADCVATAVGIPAVLHAL